MKLSKKQLAKINANRKWDEKENGKTLTHGERNEWIDKRLEQLKQQPIDHLGLPKPDYEERYGKLPKAWNTMTDEQKKKYLR